MTVWLLWMTVKVTQYDLLLGVYSTKERAEFIKSLNEASQHPDLFELCIEAREVF